MQLKAKQQKGFTIIELVVVILLLGILAATALPRFLDVTTEAHDAVVDGTASGLQTAVALFKAQVVAQGGLAAGDTVTEFGSLPTQTNGYPGGIAGTGTLTTHAECVAIFTGLLQVGAPAVIASTVTPVAVLADGDLTGVTEGFVAKATTAGTCTYAYVGDAERRTAATVPTIVYTLSSGAVVKTIP